MPAQVSITWKWIEFSPSEDTESKIQEKLRNAGVELEKLSRAVYVIRVANLFAIKYPKKYSPTLYIGEGDFIARIIRHREWLSTIYEITGNHLSLEVAVCTPRVTGNKEAHKEFEAYLLSTFKEQYGSL